MLADTQMYCSCKRQTARMSAISGSNGIDDILKRAMGNRSSLFKRT
jgi:hypothetical protein